MADIVKVKGIAVDFGGTTRVVPPLALGAMQQLQEGLANFTGDVRDPQQLALVIDTVYAAVRRNYPEITREEVADDLDLGNFREVFEAAMDVSGLKRRTLEAEAAGEAPPAA